MKQYKVLFIVTLLWGWLLFPINLCDVSILSEIGYYRRFWDTEVINVSIKCANDIINCQIGYKKKDEIEKIKHKTIFLKDYLELWKYINANNILYLKSGTLENTSLNDDEWEELYGENIPRKYSYKYEFYFNIGNESYTFSVDDIGYIKDMRYLELLNKINKLINIKTEINVFGENSKQ